MLIAIIYFPLPNYSTFEPFYPVWLGSFYNSSMRLLWGIIMAYLIYHLESNYAKHPNQSHSYIYNFLSNDIFILFSKIVIL